MPAIDSETNPYSDLPEIAFWRNAVQNGDPRSPEGIYSRKFEIARDAKIATAGSCFAQHIARHLRAQGFPVIDMERAPGGFSGKAAEAFGYGLYSARYGNVYTVRQLLQLLQETKSAKETEQVVWERDGRYFDALRPGVEPDGLESPDEVMVHRQAHLKAVARMVRTMDLFIFTLGLTEAWVHRRTGVVYPTAPGVIAGRFDPDEFTFKNFTHSEILGDLQQVYRLLKRSRPELKIILTVSPVPLTATASGRHVLPATQYSKATLRSAAGEMADLHEDVDYFPSYEIITNPAARSDFFAGNLRSIAPQGVDTVMRTFSSAHVPEEASTIAAPPLSAESEPKRAPKPRDEDDVICEEMLLDAFAKGGC
ncbi:GSCFA domain-containing protein [Chelatococcus sambhunathii]|uniref:GSCFA domain-containing protein n=2 Tax=Chelatococcus sambhunathii TaxID=363953 RepID=A0ABU1DDR6_9HYPH|nr:GSCFA domain-containing protein [Chelatococcus sambhunathii]